MALNHFDTPVTSLPELQLRDEDRFAGYEPESERSNLTAFLMGGVVVAGGLLAFLYYDTDNLNASANRDLLTTGSIGRIETGVKSEPTPSIRLLPPTADGTTR